MTPLFIDPEIRKSLGAEFFGLFDGFPKDPNEPLFDSALFPFDSIVLSPHFRVSEVVHSVTADLRGIKNPITFNQILNAAVLARTVLEPLRSFLDRPLIISSWFRSPALNYAVGGVPHSYHLEARAADIPMTSKEIVFASDWCRSHLFKFIKYKTFFACSDLKYYSTGLRQF